MHILIDGYNLIRQSSAFRRFDRLSLEMGRNALVQSLVAYKKQTGHKVTVVFDAWEGGFLTEERDRHGGINLLYSRKGETADDLIKRMIEARKEEIAVVTSDRAIADFATHRGVAAIASPMFESRLHRAVARGGNDHETSASEEEKEDKGVLFTKKKGPAHRLSKKKKQAQSIIKKL
jgi:uncharacterized protein